MGGQQQRVAAGDAQSVARDESNRAQRPRMPGRVLQSRPAPQTRPCRFGFDEACDLGTYCPGCPDRPVPYQAQRPQPAPRRFGVVLKVAAAVLAALLLGHVATKAIGQINHDRLHAAERAPW